MNLEEIRTNYKLKLEALQREMQNVLKDAFKEIFESSPNLHAIVWNQYSPYFNDGEECVFSVNDAYLLGEGWEEELGESFSANDAECAECQIPTMPQPYYYESSSNWAKECIQKWEAYPHREEMTNTYSMVKEIFAIDDEIFQGCFGNHVTVIATRDKFIVEDYSDHD